MQQDNVKLFVNMMKISEAANHVLDFIELLHMSSQ